METIGYVISAKMDDGKLEYLCIDSESGGYPYWGSFDSAKYYNSTESAAKIITESSDFTRESVMTDGKTYPPTMIQKAAGVCFNKPDGIARISIVPVIIGDAVSKFDIHAEITDRT